MERRSFAVAGAETGAVRKESDPCGPRTAWRTAVIYQKSPRTVPVFSAPVEKAGKDIYEGRIQFIMAKGRELAQGSVGRGNDFGVDYYHRRPSQPAQTGDVVPNFRDSVRAASFGRAIMKSRRFRGRHGRRDAGQLSLARVRQRGFSPFTDDLIAFWSKKG